LKNTVVVGAGIAGLACAYRLKQLGVAVTLLEEADRVGGVIGSVRQNGFLFEKGPQSFLGTETLLKLTQELGIERELVRADPRAPRFVLLKHKLHAIPMSPGALLTSSLLTPGSRFRIVSEAFRKSQAPKDEESVAQFVRRKFGHEILEYLVTPFVSGIYAGDPERLSLKSAFPSLSEWEQQYGSVLRGAMKSRPAQGKPRPSLCSFQGGNSTLLDTIAKDLGASLQLRSSAEYVEKASPTARSQFQLRIRANSDATEMNAAAIIFAAPAYVTGHLLRPFSERVAASLSGIAYAPVAVVGGGYWQKQIATPLQGFGCLVPRSEGYQVLGTVWNSSLFPGRAPEGMATLTSFIGGATNPTIVQTDPENISNVVEGDVAKILDIGGPPAERCVWRYPKALPQYNLGHAQVVTSVREEIAQMPGLFLCGNYLEGPSIGNCIEQAFRTAESVRDFLAKG
jgi:protoporphyrinogen/coproporphyrinogen III oxidase